MATEIQLHPPVMIRPTIPRDDGPSNFNDVIRIPIISREITMLFLLGDNV